MCMQGRKSERLERKDGDTTVEPGKALSGERRKRLLKQGQERLQCVECHPHLALPRNSDLKWSKAVELGVGLVESCVCNDENLPRRDDSNVLDWAGVAVEEMAGHLLNGLGVVWSLISSSWDWHSAYSRVRF